MNGPDRAPSNWRFSLGRLGWVMLLFAIYGAVLRNVSVEIITLGFVFCCLVCGVLLFERHNQTLTFLGLGFILLALFSACGCLQMDKDPQLTLPASSYMLYLVSSWAAA